MKLIEKQFLFMRLLPRLLDKAHELGFDVTGGELERTEAQAEVNAASGTGISNSLHKKRLAIDLNLFKDGSYLTKTEDHLALGTYWKLLHPLCRWGGDFTGKRPDGNHYSIEHEGVK